MREILFRGQTKEGEWIEGNFSFRYTQGKDKDGLVFTDMASIYSPEKAKAFDVFYKTVGQYTGMKDVKGKKIFEGDMVEFVFLDEPTKCFVFWSEDFLSWGLDGELICELYKQKYKMKVIGNIYDNS